MYQITKQRFPRPTVLPNLALQHVNKVFPDMYSSLIIPHKCPRTNQNIIKTYINVKRSTIVKNELKDKLLLI